MKAVLLAADGRMRRTHDLERLYRAAQQYGVAPPCTLDDLDGLTPFAVEYRYGDLSEQIEEPMDRPRTRRLAADLLTWAESCLARPTDRGGG